MSIRVLVNGALGKMGLEVIKAVCNDTQTEIAGAVDIKATDKLLLCPDQSGSVQLFVDLETAMGKTKPHVMVDFSQADGCMAATRMAAQQKVNLVIGTTGLASHDLVEIDQLAKENGIGVVVAPNFALGAVLMIHLARIAAKYFDYVEIIEKHHEQKLDAPSGTAMSTARAMREAREGLFKHPQVHKEILSGTRGGEMEGVAVHSVRMPGLLAHQEVIFGTSGQTLTIKHDSINRECFMPGVIMAIKKVSEHKGLVYGLDKLLGI